jgi:soluble P-type ATPase
MTLTVSWGDRQLELATAIFDVNGTLTVRGALIPGVAERLERLGQHVDVLLVSSDSYGTLATVAESLQVPARTVGDASEKAAILTEVGASGCVAVGNGRNDVELMRGAALGVAVIGPEGLDPALLTVADVVCGSIIDALDLLLDPSRLTATLRP